jgi:DNA-binding response OmpR family regulator
MVRKHIVTVLMIEPEMPEGVSARKLVVETAKHNVITGYEGKEGLALFHKFPKVDVVFVHSELPGRDCEKIVKEIRRLDMKIPIVVLSPTGQARCSARIDQVLPSHEPKIILDYLAERLGLSVSN